MSEKPIVQKFAEDILAFNRARQNVTDKPCDRGLLMTPGNIVAIREGRKTMMRPLLKFPQGCDEFTVDHERGLIAFGSNDFADGLVQLEDAEICRNYPYAVGQRLYIREALRFGIEWDDCVPSKVDPLCGGNDAWYTMDGEPPSDGWGRIRNALFMPKWCARTWLEVTKVHPPERVQDISVDDSVAEGIDATGLCRCPDDVAYGVRFCIICNLRLWDIVDEFKSLWDSIHAPGEWEWAKNPWVWPIELKKLKKD